MKSSSRWTVLPKSQPERVFCLVGEPAPARTMLAKAVHRIKRAIDGAHDGLDRGMAALLD